MIRSVKSVRTLVDLGDGVYLQVSLNENISKHKVSLLSELTRLRSHNVPYLTREVWVSGLMRGKSDLIRT